VPSALKVFLMTIAVADDLLAIVIIAIFYGKSLNVALLLLGFVVVGGLCFLRSYGGKHAVTAWVGLTALLWLCFEGAGLHATLAGVVAGALMPKKLLDSAVRGKPLEHRLQFAVNVAILPLFAFLNAGIPLSLGQGSGESLQLSGSIMAGLVLGKPLGIGLTCLVLLRLGLAELPQGVRARELWGVAILAGIGFTMSLFISNLSYGGQSEMMLVASRLGVFGGSLVAALAGYTYLLVVLPRPVEELEERSDSF
jgi:NhaA family Na+:H+ antiporter